MYNFNENLISIYFICGSYVSKVNQRVDGYDQSQSVSFPIARSNFRSRNFQRFQMLQKNDEFNGI